jgi:hypothetical protein
MAAILIPHGGKDYETTTWTTDDVGVGGGCCPDHEFFATVENL